MEPAEFEIGDGTVIVIDPPQIPDVVVLPVPGPPGKDGQAAIPSLIDCGGANDTSGA